MIRIIATLWCDACGIDLGTEGTETKAPEDGIERDANALLTALVWNAVRRGVFVRLVRQGRERRYEVKCLNCRKAERS